MTKDEIRGRLIDVLAESIAEGGGVMKCDKCLRLCFFISENEVRYGCMLSEGRAIKCLTGEEDSFWAIPMPLPQSPKDGT